MTTPATETITLSLPTVPVELVVLDMAGTTVRDDGVVERAFERAANETGVAERMPWAEALDYVRRTMGQSKIDVFTHLAGGDTARAVDATTAFERAYADLIAEEGVEPIAGAQRTLEQLRATGLSVVLTTGFAPTTRDAILDSLGWRALVDAALSPVDAGRGRPAPDLVLTAVIRSQASSVASVVVVGDTTSDVASGRAAGAGLVVGVLTGAHDRAALTAAGADAVIDDVSALPALLGIDA
ncbi:haloacid dehalogenase [Microbacterium sp. B35-04]|uniref:phosphonatase-like hydrolase n=1 Tax=unclassified Microbacterium TaxID=2609290 RepID=UPI0013D430AB|nr:MULTISPECIES: phosphonatase-like hydrolase [unclassified Microbacterium]KAF2413550.1 haloacid dehalogenase [Microbacterium sp. B35-04]KAF2417744.1 haloacid dehalogenase [Microbacterium sp. B35-30]